MNRETAQKPWMTVDDVGPLRRQRSHPEFRTLVSPIFLVSLVPVLLLVLLPVALTAVEAFRPGGLLRTDEDGWAWTRQGLEVAVLRTGAWVGLCVAITGTALLLAHVTRHLSSDVLGRGPVGLVRIAWLIPAAVPLLVTAIAFRLLYHPDPQRGPLTWLAVPALSDRPWLAPGWTLPVALMLAFTWMWLGYATLVFRAAARQGTEDLELVAKRRSAGRLPHAFVVFRDAYWSPSFRRVAAVAILPMLVMTGRMLELPLVTSPDPGVPDVKVLAVLHWEMAAGAVTPASAAVGIIWWGLMVGSVWFIAKLARRPRHGGQGSPPVHVQARGPTKRRKGDISTRWWGALPLAALWLVPLAVLVLTSLAPPHGAAVEGWRAASLDFGSYRLLTNAGYWTSFRMTLIVTVVAATLSTGVAIVLAGAMNDMSSRGARVVLRVLIVAAVVPVQVIAGPLHSVFDTLHSLPLIHVPEGIRLTLAHVALTIPLGVVILYISGNSPASAIEAAGQNRAAPETGNDNDDGISRLVTTTWQRARAAGRAAKAIWRDAPAAVTVYVLTFVLVWNDFAVGMFFSGRSTVPLSIFLFGETRQFTANSGSLAAGSVLMALVPVLVVAATHRPVITGLVGRAEVRP